MTAQTKTVLKGYFNTGDTPTEAQLADLIDSAKAFTQTYWVDSGGLGDYTSLVAAFAAIVDAAANKVYTIIVNGAIAETATVTAKDYINVFGLPGSSVTVTIAGAGHGFVFNNLVSSIWRGLQLIRAGAPTASQYCVNVTGTTTSGIRFENCQIIHNGTGASYMNALNTTDTVAPVFRDCLIQSNCPANAGFGAYVQGTSTPTFTNCDLIGGPYTGVASYGVMLFSTPSPLFQGCYIKGGSGGSRGLYVNHTAGLPKFFDCRIEGGDGAASSYGVYCITGATANVIFDRCYIRGGNHASAGQHAFVSDAGIQTVTNCYIAAGVGTTTCHAVHCRTPSTSVFDNCVFEGGQSNTSGYSVFVGENSSPIFRNCSNVLPRLYATHTITATATFKLSTTKVFRPIVLAINVTAAGGAGATLSLGSTLAGTDILNALDITTTGSKFIAMGAGGIIPYAANVDLYATVNAGGGAPSVTLVWYGVDCYTSEAVWIEYVGQLRFENCSFVSSPLADCVAIAATAVAAAQARFDNCVLEAMTRDGTPKKAINAAASWSPAQVYNCTLIGGTTNITAAAGTANGTNWEVP